MELVMYWVCELALLISGIIYAYVNERREYFVQKLLGFIAAYLAFAGIVNAFSVQEVMGTHMLSRLLGVVFLICMHYACWKVSKSVAIYGAIWSFMTWQLLYEMAMGIAGFMGIFETEIRLVGLMVAVFVIGFTASALTIARWMPAGARKHIGPRQLMTAILIFGTFEVVSLETGRVELDLNRWKTLYLSQLLLTLILYLQNELFKKSAMRQELEVMNLLWKKEQEQYQLSKENIALINQKCHDLKHQIRAIRNCSKEEMDKYLAEMEDSIRIYEAIVKTGNEVLDTILTEKSLYCKERGITVSCVADGSQMDFINTVDLYAILGNALDNAIEAVEKFQHEEKRQIDVVIHRQHNFLLINIINPLKDALVFEEELPVSTKGDKRYHGFGLKSMQYLVRKYDGYLNISEEDGCFSLKILIPIPSGD